MLMLVDSTSRLQILGRSQNDITRRARFVKWLGWKLANLIEYNSSCSSWSCFFKLAPFCSSRAGSMNRKRSSTSSQCEPKFGELYSTWNQLGDSGSTANLHEIMRKGISISKEEEEDRRKRKGAEMERHARRGYLTRAKRRARNLIFIAQRAISTNGSLFPRFASLPINFHFAPQPLLPSPNDSSSFHPPEVERRSDNKEWLAGWSRNEWFNWKNSDPSCGEKAKESPRSHLGLIDFSFTSSRP